MSTDSPVVPEQQQQRRPPERAQQSSIQQGPQGPPPVPPPPSKRRGLKAWHWVLIALGVLLVIGIVAVAATGCGTSSQSTGGTSPPEQTSTQVPTQAPTAAHHKVGEQVQVGSWAVTLNSAKLHGGTEFDTPEAGHTYLVVNATFKNGSSQPQTMSTVVQVTMKDSAGQRYTETFVGFAEASPDGTVEPGGQTRGEIVYEVPTSVHQFTFTFQPDMFDSTLAMWDVNV
jgi:hypothetical protein